MFYTRTCLYELWLFNLGVIKYTIAVLFLLDYKWLCSKLIKKYQKYKMIYIYIGSCTSCYLIANFIILHFVTYLAKSFITVFTQCTLLNNLCKICCVLCTCLAPDNAHDLQDSLYLIIQLNLQYKSRSNLYKYSNEDLRLQFLNFFIKAFSIENVNRFALIFLVLNQTTAWHKSSSLLTIVSWSLKYELIMEFNYW